ncbi:MAG: hypothetical protein GF388_01665 [Candidatus Aegiribacteria sp.]|nr:hypothetical protein [Candidatus Aegiribacteria sp.]MBD3294081.1 hypothetical protein [Candidatus Fermentibacteria bacterium]
MVRSLECPNCGADLKAGRSGTEVCRYCGSTLELGGKEPKSGDGRLSTDDIGQIEDNLRNGNKIEAIKIYRRATSASLKQSKLAVESMARNIGVPVRSGCSSVLLASFLGFMVFVLLIGPF